MVLLTDEPITLPREIASLYNTKKGYRIVHSVIPLSPVEPPSEPVSPPLPPPINPPPGPQIHPLTCPPRSPVKVAAMLWLSRRIVEWKFLARYLGMAEVDVSRIELENPKNIAEQTFQMLDTWSRHSVPEVCNYQVLCEKLMEAEMDRDLHEHFVAYINEIEES